MKRIPANLLKYPGDGLHYLDEVPFTGLAFYLAKDGFERSQLLYKDGLLSGRTTEWYAPKIQQPVNRGFPKIWVNIWSQSEILK